MKMNYITYLNLNQLGKWQRHDDVVDDDDGNEQRATANIFVRIFYLHIFMVDIRIMFAYSPIIGAHLLWFAKIAFSIRRHLPSILHGGRELRIFAFVIIFLWPYTRCELFRQRHSSFVAVLVFRFRRDTVCDASVYMERAFVRNKCSILLFSLSISVPTKRLERTCIHRGTR